mmetsp:Transcript_52328/g.124914  ORF Transcript_52328/g.124914 Transcript_52328/m.124914 type:complete len:609 (-) Transcript_52328:74-1900(-)
MPPKRPAPLSDAYIQPAAKTAASNVLGESVPLPVKNTFIDVPSGLTPAAMKSASADRTLSLSTAPANLDPSKPLFQQALLSAALQAQQAQQGSAAPTPKGRTISKVQATPLQTPSPTHAARMSSHWATIAASAQPPVALLNGFAAATEQVNGATFAYPAPAPAPRVVQTTQYPYTLSTSPPQVLLPPLVNSFPVSTGGAPAGTEVSACTLAPAVLTSASTTAGAVAPAPAPAPVVSAVTTAPVESEILSAKVTPLPLARVRRAQEHPTVQEDEEADDDSDIEAEQLRLQANRRIEDAPQRPPDAEHPSLGSAAHLEGQCKRCCFYPRGRCLNGYECEFCHYDHEKRKRKNKKKKKKDASGSITAAVSSVVVDEKSVVVPSQTYSTAAVAGTTVAVSSSAAPSMVYSTVGQTTTAPMLPTSTWDGHSSSVVYMPSTSPPPSGTILSTVGPPPAFPYAPATMPYMPPALPQQTMPMSSGTLTLAAPAVAPATAAWAPSTTTVTTVTTTATLAPAAVTAAPAPATLVTIAASDAVATAPPPPLQSPKLPTVMETTMFAAPPSGEIGKALLLPAQPPPPMESPKFQRVLDLTHAPSQPPLQSPKMMPMPLVQ